MIGKVVRAGGRDAKMPIPTCSKVSSMISEVSGMIGWNISVCKSNRFHVDVLHKQHLMQSLRHARTRDID